MAYTQEELRERYLKLPKQLQDALFSVDSAEAIRQIGEKHKLMIDKIGLLADETGYVMLGLTHPKDFISRIVERLGVDQKTSRELAEEINEKIFSPVREHLKKLHGLGEEIEKPEIEKPKSENLTEDLTKEKEETLKAIENEVPPILRGVAKPEPPMPIPPPLPSPPLPATPPTSAFEVKTQENILRTPAVTSQIKPTPSHKYPVADPYREPTE
ncbi:MAG: hypothetical protein UV22_C0011G0020 [Parcubacteria group bacterium GW2011_GWA2_42_35]|nr:MAG: hypothetical protein UU96_C0005G0007 [Parcubacteria group bacterium GW2011_GWC2_42_13]KKS57867.1 MAG: hypothetical protein UV22_C0011G0020 [Parcubacteria group bacterium GW2011_GWA2_42_35]